MNTHEKRSKSTTTFFLSARWSPRSLTVAFAILLMLAVLGPFSSTSALSFYRPMLNLGVVHYVNHAATGTNTGTAWVDAFTDLSSALAVAQPGDEIWVATGTYFPTSGTDRTATFRLKDAVNIFGGFVGVETSRSEREWQVNPTVLSGDLSKNDNDNVRTDEPLRTDNSFHVVTAIDVGSSTILDGFSIVGGNANVYPYENGAGLYNERSHLTLSNLSFTHNSALYHGGAIFNIRSSPTLTHTTVISNYSAQYGGGIANLSNSHPFITHSTIAHNL
jgi:hypothetical protein